MITILPAYQRSNPVNSVQLTEIPITPRGNRGPRWKGVQHGVLVHTIIKILHERYGFFPINPQYYVSPNGASLIGGFELGSTDPEDCCIVNPVVLSTQPQEVHAAIGFTHSNDSRKSLRIALGGRVLLCDNGVVSGEYRLARRHTSGLHLESWISEGLKRFWTNLTQQWESVEVLQRTFLSPAQHERGVTRLGRDKILPWRMLGAIDKAWLTAVHDNRLVWLPESASGVDWGFQRSAWDWYNAVTHQIKQLSPVAQFRALRGAFKIALDLTTSA